MEASFSIAPAWELLSSVTEQARAFFVAQGAPASSADALAMVATELSENAVKYGLPGQDPLYIRLIAEPGEYQIEVSNVVREGDPENLRRLDDMVQWIRGFQDPFQAYVERLREVSSQRPEDSRSGLGLVRAAYEGRAVLDFIVDQNNRLTVSAVRRD